MLITEKEFYKKYGDIYKKKLEEANFYVKNPDKLKEKIDKENISDNKRLKKPSVDKFTYDLIHYKGFLKYPHRLKNYIISKEEIYVPVRHFFPTIMDLEPNSRCNFRCIMCQVSEWKNGKRADDMSYEDFKKFIDENNYFTEIKLHGMGEPLLHKDYMKMVKYLSSQYIWTRTSINGSLLHIKENYKRLIDAEIGEVQCSFDGASKEVYEAIRKNSNFEQVVKNFTLLNQYANKKKRLYTRMWALIQKSNRHQIFDFVELARKMEFRRISFSVSLNDWGKEEWNRKNREKDAAKFTKEEHLKLLELAKKYDIDITLWEQSSSYSISSINKLCPWVFNRPYITSDLKVVPCCMIADPEVVNFGDSRKFKDVWNNKKYQEFRQLHLDGKIPQCCRGCYEL